MVVLSIPVIGQGYDAYADSSDLVLCKGEVFEQSIIIDSQFNTDKVLDAKEISELPVSLIPEKSFLGPGEKLSLNYLLPTRNIEVGEYESEVILKADDLSKSIIQKVRVRTCDNINLITEDNSFSNCPCKTTIYKAKVMNTGNFRDSFDLSIDINEKFYSLSQEEISLNPKESKDVYIFVKLPCEKVGNYSFNLLAESKVSGFEEKKPFYLNLRGKCYDFEISFGDINKTGGNVTPGTNFSFPGNNSYNLCLNNSYQIPIILENTGEINNSYSVKSNLPDGFDIFFPNGSVSVNKFSSGYLKVDLGNLSDERIIKSDIIIETGKGEVSKSYELSFCIDDCRFDDKSDKAKPWLVILVIGSLLLFLCIILCLFFFILAKNKKDKSEKEEAISARQDTSITQEEAKKKGFLDNHPWLKKNLKWIYLLLIILLILLFFLVLGYFYPADSISQNLNVSDNLSLGGNESMDTGSAQLSNLTEKTNESALNESTRVNQTNDPGFFSGLKNGFFGYLLIYKFYILAGILLLFLLLLLLHKGLFFLPGKSTKKDAGKKKGISSKAKSASSSKASSKKSASKKKKLTPKHSGKSLLFYLLLAFLFLFLVVFLLRGCMTGEYGTQQKGNETNENITNESLFKDATSSGINESLVKENYSENLSPVAGKNASVSKDKSKDAFDSIFNYLNLYKYYIIFGLIILVLLLLFVHLAPAMKNQDKVYRLFLIIISLVLLFILLVFFWYSNLEPKQDIQNFENKTNTSTEVIQKHVLKENSTNYVMRKNTEKTIDFEPYIKDESDNVSMKVTPMDNISASFIGKKLKLIPDSGWYGKRVFNLIAIDEHGASSYSNDITIWVLNKEPWLNTLWGNTKAFFKDYLPYVITLIAGVILSVILLLKYVSDKKS
ncbi:MAG: hypothetical protein ACQESF_03725 [Nanobdellota archaeon]